ncbi:hypothetical protein ACSSS7_002165 [Eimeria intestinalis]
MVVWMQGKRIMKAARPTRYGVKLTGFPGAGLTASLTTTVWYCVGLGFGFSSLPPAEVAKLAFLDSKRFWSHKQKGDPCFMGVPMRWVALLALVGQTVASVMVLRLSRTSETSAENRYLTTTAVVCAEVVKLSVAVPLVCYEQNMSLSRTIEVLKRDVLGSPKDVAKLGVPGLLYSLQNNLIFVALSNLSGAVYQVTYQLKILTTALLSVTLLGRRLPPLKWTALLLLFSGVALIQYPGQAKSSEFASKTAGQSSLVGLVAVLCACLTSGLAGVYLEKLLKQKTTTIWLSNMQLALYGLLAGLMGAFWNDGPAILKDGFFQGYTRLTVAAILLQALGGLVVSAVLKYADNILKCFGNAVSIIFSCLVSWVVIGDFSPSSLFCVGTCLVLVATYIYIVDKPLELLEGHRMLFFLRCKEQAAGDSEWISMPAAATGLPASQQRRHRLA